jgi:hypothetical protein
LPVNRTQSASFRWKHRLLRESHVPAHPVSFSGGFCQLAPLLIT